MTQLFLDPETGTKHALHTIISDKLREMFVDNDYLPYCSCEWCRDFRRAMPNR